MCLTSTTALGSAFPLWVCVEHLLSRRLLSGTAKSSLVCVSVMLSGGGSGPGHGRMLQLIPPVPF